MNFRTSRGFLAALFLVGTLAAWTHVIPAAGLHFDLSKSLPEADASVEAPAEVRLWFTQEPQEGTVSIRVMDASEEAAMMMDVTQSEEDPLSFGIGFHHPPQPGVYTVAWRGMGADGHVVRNSFEFTVTGE